MTFRQVTAMKPKCAQSQKSLYYLLYGKENKQLTKPKNIMKAKGHGQTEITLHPFHPSLFEY